MPGVSNLSYPYYTRSMTQQDTSDVTEIDREAFPTQWPPADYQYEMRNSLAHYIVVCDQERTIAEPPVNAIPDNHPPGTLTRLRKWLSEHLASGNSKPPSPRHYTTGFAGFWTLADEAHIIIIAVREAYRQWGLGELLLISLINLAIEMKAGVVTLEVRVSNTVAQNLYLKYGFTEVGMRKGYYIDRIDNTETREDGMLMSTQNITSAEYQALFQQLKQAHSEKWGVPLEQYAGR